MGRIIKVHVNDDTEAMLLRAAASLNRTIEDLAECAVTEETLTWARQNSDTAGMTPEEIRQGIG